jgi:hypothetical protein
MASVLSNASVTADPGRVLVFRKADKRVITASIQGSRGPQDRGVTTNLVVREVDQAIEFYQRALSAEVLYRGTMPNGMTPPAQLRVETSFILLSVEMISHEGMPTDPR